MPWTRLSCAVRLDAPWITKRGIVPSFWILFFIDWEETVSSTLEILQSIKGCLFVPLRLLGPDDERKDATPSGLALLIFSPSVFLLCGRKGRRCSCAFYPVSPGDETVKPAAAEELTGRFIHLLGLLSRTAGMSASDLLPRRGPWFPILPSVIPTRISSLCWCCGAESFGYAAGDCLWAPGGCVRGRRTTLLIRVGGVLRSAGAITDEAAWRGRRRRGHLSGVFYFRRWFSRALGLPAHSLIELRGTILPATVAEFEDCRSLAAG